MGKIISTFALIIMIVLFPPAALITVSQEAVQGDATYPIKRWLESQVLFLASFNPTTRALYAVAQANRRYDESAKLLSMGNDAGSTLKELVTQSNIAAGDINQVGNDDRKVQLIGDLTSSIAKYDQGLAEAQAQITRTSGVESSQPVTAPQPSTVALPDSPQPKSSPAEDRFKPAPSPVNQQTPAPSVTGKPTPSPVTPSDEEARRKQQEIEKTRKELEELRKRLEEEKKKLQEANKAKQSSSTPTPSPSPTPTPLPSPQATVSPEADTQPSPSPVVKKSRNKANSNPKWNKTDNDPGNDDDNGDDD